MKAATARAIFKFADAVVFLENVRAEKIRMTCKEAGHHEEADKICEDALSNLKAAREVLFQALETEDLS